MKKTILGLLMPLAVTVAACGSDSKTAEPAATTVAAAAATTAAPVALPAAVQALKAKGKITVGVKFDVPLFGLKNPTNSQIEGFDVEIGKMITKTIFGDDSKVEFVEAVSKNREPFIQEGKVDLVISTYTINDTRKQIVDFAGPYYVAGQDILVKSDDTSIKGIAGVRDYFARALDRNPTLRFDPMFVTTGLQTVNLIYRRMSGDLAAEVFFLNADLKITRSISHYG